MGEVVSRASGKGSKTARAQTSKQGFFGKGGRRGRRVSIRELSWASFPRAPRRTPPESSSSPSLFPSPKNSTQKKRISIADREKLFLSFSAFPSLCDEEFRDPAARPFPTSFLPLLETCALLPPRSLSEVACLSHVKRQKAGIHVFSIR